MNVGMNVGMNTIVLQWCSVVHVVSSYANIVTTITDVVTICYNVYGHLQFCVSCIIVIAKRSE